MDFLQFNYGLCQQELLPLHLPSHTHWLPMYVQWLCRNFLNKSQFVWRLLELKNWTELNNFTFMHLAEAFIKWLTVHSDYTFFISMYFNE